MLHVSIVIVQGFSLKQKFLYGGQESLWFQAHMRSDFTSYLYIELWLWQMTGLP